MVKPPQNWQMVMGSSGHHYLDYSSNTEFGQRWHFPEGWMKVRTTVCLACSVSRNSKSTVWIYNKHYHYCINRLSSQLLSTYHRGCLDCEHVLGSATCRIVAHTKVWSIPSRRWRKITREIKWSVKCHNETFKQYHVNNCSVQNASAHIRKRATYPIVESSGINTGKPFVTS